jgi:hypothetical protein
MGNAEERGFNPRPRTGGNTMGLQGKGNTPRIRPSIRTPQHVLVLIIGSEGLATAIYT